MKFTAKGDYGMIAALDLALNGDHGPVHVRHIAQRQGIPLRFLEQVMSSLKKAGLVESVRGAHGGYRLARPPEEIHLSEILLAIEGPLAPMNCMAGEDICILEEGVPSGCVVKEVWQEVKASILGVLNSITLKDVCERKTKRENLKALTLQI